MTSIYCASLFLLLPYLALAATGPSPLPEKKDPLNEVHCTISFEPPEAASRFLENCLVSIHRENVAFVSVVVRSKVRKKLKPAVRRAEERRDFLRAEIVKHFPGIDIKDSLETRSNVDDLAVVTVFRKQSTQIDERQAEEVVKKYAALVAPAPALILPTPALSERETSSYIFSASFGKESFSGKSYKSLGVSGMWHKPQSTLWRFEAGARVGVLSDDVLKDLYSVSLLPGVGITSEIFSLSTHALLGTLGAQPHSCVKLTFQIYYVLGSIKNPTQPIHKGLF